MRKLVLMATLCFSTLPMLAVEGQTVPEKGDSDATKIECIQPKLAAWNKIATGMSENEVKTILGEPLHETVVPKQFENDPKYVRFATYGRIQFNNPAVPGNFEYRVAFKLGVVSEKYDPFDGKLSKDGEPTVPTPILPADKTKFNHYPRFLDMRWNPSSGDYPIKYEVEVELDQATQEGIKFFPETRKTTSIPYCVTLFGGKNYGRWHVRATNKLGTSEWSEWRYFRFEK